MAAKNVILALLALTSFAYGQTRALFVNTNGTVQWGNTLRFDGPLDFTTNTQAATTRSNLSLGLPALTNTSNAGLLLALGALATNGSASALTNFPALVLTTNSSESVFPSALLRTSSTLSLFPAGLLRTNGDGSGLTNLPNANLSNATGILPIANGGTGTNSAAGARAALQLGTAATNDASAFQPANTNLTALASGNGSNLTNVTITDASTLTNFPASLLRTNGDGSGLSNVSVNLTSVLPSYSNNAGKVLSVAAGATNVEWVAVSNTVTDASALTNFPSLILQSNSAEGSFPAFLLRTNGSAAGLTAFPTLNQNTTGTASNVTGVVAISNGGSGQITAAAAIQAFLPSYSGNSNRILALNSNASGLVWTTNAGGGGLTSPVALVDGGTGATNARTALTNFGIFQGSNSIFLTNSPGTISSDSSVAIGIGNWTGVSGIAVGNGAQSRAQNAIAIGTSADASSVHSVAIGASADVGDNGDRGITIGHFARTGANVTDAIQLGTGTNGTLTSIQFRSAGSVDTNEWAALANAGTVGTNLLRSTNITGAQAAIFTNSTTNAPTNTNAPTPTAWLDIRVGTNDYKLPLWQ